LACLLSAVAALPGIAEVASSSETFSGPPVASRSAVLIDATTGAILYEKDADAVIPPASLTKLMTMHVVLEEVAAGRISLDDKVALPRETWATNQPWGSSLMFLAPGQTVTLREILLGMAVSSGNDAAVAAAIHTSSSVDAFIERMNIEARKLGLSRTHFVDPSGYSEFNLTTARDFAAFCRIYISRHPETLTDFHSVREFAYPAPANLPEAFKDRPGTVIQNNRNLLLGEVEGVDGLKTGYTPESGYNIALTAKRGRTRLLMILLGGPGANSTQGGRIRAEDGGRLLDWGFAHFRTIYPVVEHIDPIRIWKGKRNEVDLVPTQPLEFTAGNDRAATVTWELRRNPAPLAPVAAGDILGEIIFSDQFGELRRVPLGAAGDVEAGNLWKRAFDSVVLFFLRLFGRIAQ
jgi:D-alanyl-D-alanine carboxypeptidase (penicillin-binding protein 5/6)